MLRQAELELGKKEDHGKHNGAKSVANCLGTQVFKRVRVGIGKPEDENNLIDHVIGEVPEEEFKPLKEGISQAVDAVSVIIKYGMIKAMNDYN